jgi:hypothetical protein
MPEEACVGCACWNYFEVNSSYRLSSKTPWDGALVHTSRQLRIPYRKLREFCLLQRRKAHYHVSLDNKQQQAHSSSHMIMFNSTVK